METIKEEVEALVARTDSIEARARALKQRESALDDASKRLLKQSQEISMGSSQTVGKNDIDILISDFEDLLVKAKSISLIENTQTIDPKKKEEIMQYLQEAQDLINKKNQEKQK